MITTCLLISRVLGSIPHALTKPAVYAGFRVLAPDSGHKLGNKSLGSKRHL